MRLLPCTSYRLTIVGPPWSGNRLRLRARHPSYRMTPIPCPFVSQWDGDGWCMHGRDFMGLISLAILTSKWGFGRNWPWLSQNQNGWCRITISMDNRPRQSSNILIGSICYLTREIHYWSYFWVTSHFSWGRFWFEPKRTVAPEG